MSSLLVIAAVIAAILLLRAWPRQTGRGRLKWAVYIIAAAIVFLAATGRLHWLAAIGAALAGIIPIIAKKLFLLFRFIPLLSGFLSRAGYGKTGNARFETAWLRLEVNPRMGTLDGEILQGEFKARRLSSMSLAELQKLLATLRGQDMKSAMLLQSYLAIRSRAHARSSGGDERPGTGHMTREEALSILGLKEGASREEIIRAYKSLMQKIHPDRGGSAYLAAKINQAKELLLEGK